MSGTDQYTRAAGGGDRTPIDSHVHFWDPSRLSYPWLSSAPEINRPFTPQDFSHTVPEPVDAVFVEAGRSDHQAVDELDWVREQARTRPWILGAVAHAPLEDRVTAEALIGDYAHDPFVVGVRRNIQDEAAGFTSSADFRAGVSMLGEAGLPFDACVRLHQLPELAELAESCPRTVIVLDHLGKPSAANLDPSWRQAMDRLANSGNVVCKLSGLATETSPDTEPGLIVSLLHEALEAFGPDRCLYGGDWPVMTLATGYGTWLDLVRTALAGFCDEAADAVLRTNAIRTYGLDRAKASPRHRTREEPA
jgi:L-fuconolactonase